MRIDHVYAAVKTILRTNMDVVVLSIIYLLIVIFGGICVYLAEHEHPGANITTIGDALWWGIVTIATVGYGDYYPVTAIGRIIAVFMTVRNRYLCTFSRFSFSAQIAENRVKVEED